MLEKYRKRDQIELYAVSTVIWSMLLWMLLRRDWIFTRDSSGSFSDPMMVSGFVTAFAGILLSLLINRKFRAMLRRLLKDGILEGGVRDADDFETELRRRAFKWRLLTAFGIAVLMAIGFYNFYGWPDSGFLAEFTIASILLGAVAGHRLGAIIANGRLAKVARERDIRLLLVLDHPDGAGGTAALGNFLMFQAILITIILVWLSVWLILLPGYPGYQSWEFHLATLWLVALAIFGAGFVYPVLAFRKQMREAKNRLTARVGGEIDQSIAKLAQKKISTSDVADFMRNNEQHVAQINMRRALDELPSIPLGTIGKSLFRVTSLSAFVPPAFDILVTDDNAAGGWMKSTVGLVLKNIGL